MIYINFNKFEKESLKPALNFCLSLFAKLFVEQKGENEFQPTFTEYITIDNLNKEIENYYLNQMTDIHPDYWAEVAYKIIEESGFLRITYDENHYPPQTEVGVTSEIINMMKFCIAVLTRQNNKDFTILNIEIMLTENLSHFTNWNEELVEKPCILSSVIKKVYEATAYYVQHLI